MLHLHAQVLLGMVACVYLGRFKYKDHHNLKASLGNLEDTVSKTGYSLGAKHLCVQSPLPCLPLSLLKSPEQLLPEPGSMYLKIHARTARLLWFTNLKAEQAGSGDVAQ